MKLLISTFVSLLLIGFAGGTYGQPDFEETKLLAEQGNAPAQYNLGFKYDLREGVPVLNTRCFNLLSIDDLWLVLKFFSSPNRSAVKKIGLGTHSQCCRVEK